MRRIALLLAACCAALPASAAPSASVEQSGTSVPAGAARPFPTAPGVTPSFPSMPDPALSLLPQGPDLRLDASVQAAMANPVPNTAMGLKAEYFTLKPEQAQAAGAPQAVAAGRVLEAASVPGARAAVGAVTTRVYDGGREVPKADFIETKEAPAGASSRDYLSRARRLSGAALLRELSDVTGPKNGFRPIGYESAQRALFASVDRVKVKGRPGVRDAYSDAFIEDPSLLSVEHVWPQSLYGSQAPMRSDLHGLLSTLAASNAARGDKPYGMSPDAFEPPDAAKGRVARAMLYFYTRYQDRGIAKTEETSRFWNRQLPLMLDWNRRFPPTSEEKRSNDMAQIEQGNRNPYTDEPGLADRIGEAAFRARAR